MAAYRAAHLGSTDSCTRKNADGLGIPEMDMGWVHPWVGLGWVVFSSTCDGLGWVVNEK